MASNNKHTEERHLLGIGSLNWDVSERRCDRYGSVALCNMNSNEEVVCKTSVDIGLVNHCVGKKGKLIAKVVKQQQSNHIGDLFRGFSPSTPALHTELELGEGTLFAENKTWAAICVGLNPEDGRETDWLNPEILYQAHEQIVELYFQETAN